MLRIGPFNRRCSQRASCPQFAQGLCPLPIADGSVGHVSDPQADRNGGDPVAPLARSQGGAVSRRQLRALGVSRSYVRAQLRGRRWQRPLPGVFVVFTGPLPFVTKVWSALLYASKDAVASHDTAAWLAELRPDPPRVIDVSVPHGRRHRGSRPGVRVRQSRRLAEKTHPARLPPQTRLEETVLDLTDEATTEDPVIDLVLRACQRRLTSASRLAAAATRRKRLRWRRLVTELVAEVREGVLTPLERRYFRDVERAQGFPGAAATGLRAGGAAGATATCAIDGGVWSSSWTAGRRIPRSFGR